MTDNKVPQTDGTYESVVVSASDYYPFGMAMAERTYSNSEYRYGFNGQEQSDELDQNGNSYTAEFWQYSATIGRRWNIDPVVVHWESGYAVFRNSPISFSDPNGDCPDGNCPDDNEEIYHNNQESLSNTRIESDLNYFANLLVHNETSKTISSRVEATEPTKKIFQTHSYNGAMTIYTRKVSYIQKTVISNTETSVIMDDRGNEHKNSRLVVHTTNVIIESDVYDEVGVYRDGKISWKRSSHAPSHSVSERTTNKIIEHDDVGVLPYPMDIASTVFRSSFNATRDRQHPDEFVSKASAGLSDGQWGVHITLFLASKLTGLGFINSKSLPAAVDILTLASPLYTPPDVKNFFSGETTDYYYKQTWRRYGEPYEPILGSGKKNKNEFGSGGALNQFIK